jgi:hypothetical protein
VKAIYESPRNDVATVIGFADGDSTVVVSPCSMNGPGVTCNLHLPVADAEQLAADILAAVKAVREAQAKPVEVLCTCEVSYGRCAKHNPVTPAEPETTADPADHGPEVR